MRGLASVLEGTVEQSIVLGTQHHTQFLLEEHTDRILSFITCKLVFSLFCTVGLKFNSDGAQP